MVEALDARDGAGTAQRSWRASEAQARHRARADARGRDLPAGREGRRRTTPSRPGRPPARASPPNEVVRSAGAPAAQRHAGEVLFDAASRGRYATDASIYQIVPAGVLVPTTRRRRRRRDRHRARAEGAGAAARRRHQPVRPDHRRRAGHRPQQAPAPRARDRPRRAAPRPSSPASCSTAERAAASRTACGSRSTCPPARRPRSAAWRATTRAARAPSPTATWCTTCSASTRGCPTASASQFGPVAELRGRAREIATFVRELARAAPRARSSARWPKVLRRVGGYNLDIFHNQSERPYTGDGSVNLAHLLVGSEGTLAVTRSAHAEARRAAARARARRRQLPDLPRRDGVQRSTS